MHQSSRFVDEISAWLAGRLDLPQDQVRTLIESPPRDNMGDYALPCFTRARQLRKSPKLIAEELAADFPPSELVERAEAIGPYVNFFVNRGLMTADVLERIEAAGEAYGSSDEGEGRRLVIDYSSPNIAKHLGVHHIRSVAIGKAIYNLYTTLGYACHGLNFLGDWGTNFGQLVVAIEKYADGMSPDAFTIDDLMRFYVRFHAEAEKDPALMDAGRRAFARIEAGDPEALRLWQKIKEVSLKEFESLYAMLGAKFDEISGESRFVDKALPTLETMKQSGLAVESEGAMIVDLEPYGMPPCLLQKSDGATLYELRDIAAVIEHFKRFQFHRMVYVVGSEQKLRFRQIFKILELMGCEWANCCVHVDFGLIKFLDEETGKASTGSTRKGRIIMLKDVLDEAIERARAKIQQNQERFPDLADVDGLARQVGIGAVIFSDLGVRRSKDVLFDWDKILDFEGDTGPYIQYAHARLCSILRKAGPEPACPLNYGKLYLPQEWRLVRLLDNFPTAIRQAAEQYEPCVIANYLLELCAAFSRYYSAGMKDPSLRVITDDEPVRKARLALVRATLTVIRKGLSLLGIAAPEMM